MQSLHQLLRRSAMLEVDRRFASIQVIDDIRAEQLPLLFRIPKEQADVAFGVISCILTCSFCFICLLLRLDILRRHEGEQILNQKTSFVAPTNANTAQFPTVSPTSQRYLTHMKKFGSLAYGQKPLFFLHFQIYPI